MIPNMMKVADPLPETTCPEPLSVTFRDKLPETTRPEPLGVTFRDMLHKQQSELITIDKMCQGIACSLMDAKITAVNTADECNSISRILEDNGALITDIINRLNLIITKIG